MQLNQMVLSSPSLAYRLIFVYVYFDVYHYLKTIIWEYSNLKT